MAEFGRSARRDLSPRALRYRAAPQSARDWGLSWDRGVETRQCVKTADWMAVRAVSSEPVSAAVSLLNRENTGNILKIGARAPRKIP